MYCSANACAVLQYGADKRSFRHSQLSSYGMRALKFSFAANFVAVLQIHDVHYVERLYRIIRPHSHVRRWNIT